MLQETNPADCFIYLDQALSNQGILHAQELNLRAYNKIFFVINRSSSEIFDLALSSDNHWAVGIICEDGYVFFGDTLYKNMPNNFLDVVNDYYTVKFGKSLNKDAIKNLSGNKNFPSQRDGNICGMTAIMVLILA